MFTKRKGLIGGVNARIYVAFWDAGAQNEGGYASQLLTPKIGYHSNVP